MVAKHVIQHAPTIFLGVSYMNAFLASAASLLAGGIAGYFIAKRGWTGVQIDINNIKNDIENLKNKISPATVVTTPVATVAQPATVTVV